MMQGQARDEEAIPELDIQEGLPMANPSPFPALHAS
jgi:hypothetical protein